MGGGEDSEEECLQGEFHESQSVMGGGEDSEEECLQGEFHEAVESIEVLLSSLADNQKPYDMMGYIITEKNECEQDRESLPEKKLYFQKKLPEVTVQALGHLLEEEQPAMAISDNSKESDKQIPPPSPCPSDEQQKPKDNGDLSDDSPNSSDHSDHSDGEHHYDIPIHSLYKYDPFRFMHGRERRNCGYSCSFSDRRNHWNDGYPFMYGFRNLWNPMRNERYNSRSCWSWPSPEPDCEKESYTVGAGLSNPHLWTCFLNCILQCMVHTVPLVLKLRKTDHPDPCPRASIGFCCYCSLKQHVNESIRLSGSSFYPEIFINRLKSISSDFKSGVQQDAQEFLRCLLDKLDEDSIAPRSSEESSTTKEGSVVKEIFRGCLKSQLRCPECDRCSDKSEPFLDLSLDLNMVETLMDALQSFTNTELIKDFMCDGCKSRVSMEKHFKIEQAPEVLVIHLKRFTNSESKIWDKVKYPLELDINSFMSSSDDTLQKYDLYGVVEHLGAYGSGHYVCYIRSSEADWYKFNDDKVYQCSVDSALENAAYLLFYVKQGSSPWFSTLLEKEDKCPLDGSVSLEEQGKVALVNKEEEATSCHGQRNGPTLIDKEEEATSSHGQGNGPTLPDLSEQLQRNGNGNTLSDASDELEEGFRLGETSTGTQGPSCLIGSDKNGHADGCWEPSGKMKDVSPRGSLNRKEMKPSTCGSLEVDHAVTHGGSPRKNENNCHLLQLSHKCKDNCDSLEVDHAVTQGGSPRKNENYCHLLQLPHKRKDNCCHRNLSLQDEIGGCCGAPSMGMCTSGKENERVESMFHKC
ncbi:hypothetical protein SORBI_3001G287900 [Sorghum bicolor]|uniref:USP domain-containing protein n=1 Tax=Sorghum bicolor TaxID=4558 RepID=A0A1Z5S830_SORBI|nr:hypothetical protein SORBI_3001G287900 [Sorghum bicolor]